MQTRTYAVAVPGERNLIDTLNPATGLTDCCNETLEQVRLRYPGAEIVCIDEWCAQRGKEQDAPIEWSEVTEDKYDDMLNVLPPAAWVNGRFLVGEPWDHHALSGRPRYAAFVKRGGKCYASSRPITVKEFHAL